MRHGGRPRETRRHGAAARALFGAVFLSAAAGAFGAPLLVTESGVLLRENPGADGRVLRALEKGEAVDAVESTSLWGDDEYLWLYVKTRDENGWMYGRDAAAPPPKRSARHALTAIEDAALVEGQRLVLCGNRTEDFLAVLGTPKDIIDDVETDFYIYGDNSELMVTVLKKTKRVTNIFITGAAWHLANGLRVGMNVREIPQAPDYKTDGVNVYELKNRYRTRYYDSHVIVSYTGGGEIYGLGVSSPFSFEEK